MSKGKGYLPLNRPFIIANHGVVDCKQESACIPDTKLHDSSDVANGANLSSSGNGKEFASHQTIEERHAAKVDIEVSAMFEVLDSIRTSAMAA